MSARAAELWEAGRPRLIDTCLESPTHRHDFAYSGEEAEWFTIAGVRIPNRACVHCDLGEVEWLNGGEAHRALCEFVLDEGIRIRTVSPWPSPELREWQ